MGEGRRDGASVGTEDLANEAADKWKVCVRLDKGIASAQTHRRGRNARRPKAELIPPVKINEIAEAWRVPAKDK